MLQEIAITPGAFDSSSYSSTDTCDAHFEGLKQALLEWTIIRGLRDGGWKEAVWGLSGSMSPRAREILKKLHIQNRVFGHVRCLANPPASDSDWCLEAIESCKRLPLHGILTSESTKSAFAKDPLVASVAKRYSALWWNQLEDGHPGGHQSGRTLADYRSRLHLIFRHARSLIFLDPHLDPTRPGYAQFLDLIDEALTRAHTPPIIEIHRCCTEGSGREKRIVPNGEWEKRFRSKWSAHPSARQIEVFIWSKNHDRHLISDLIGIHIGNGFDLSNDGQDRISWSRISRKNRDEVQRTVDPAVNPNLLMHRFKIQT